MGKVFEITIKESVEELKTFHRKEKNLKKKLRLLSLILTKEDQFHRRVDLADYLGVNITTLNKWADKYRDSGMQGMLEMKSGGNRRE
ncbi:MAG: putative transposase, partial [Flavobacteriales bacterium]